MTTALDIIKGALKLNGKLGQGESLGSYDSSDGLTALNDMLDSWWNERLAVFQIRRQTHTLVAGTGSYTIGSSGTINTTRPNKIVGAFITSSSIDYPMRVIDVKAYDAISAKTTQSDIPQYLYYQPSYPLGIIYLWPVPSAANTLNYDSWLQIQSFSTLTTAVSLPPGYERALRYNLAVETAPLFGVSEPSAIVIRIATESKAAISRTNSPAMISQVDAGLVGHGTLYNVNTDE